jgi:autotransporter-associated beta strand protein
VSLGAITNLTGSEISFGSTVANNGFSLTVTESGTGQFSGAISGGGGLTKAGGGTTSLAAANTYGGATTINAGTLLVDGSIVNSTTTVNSGGTLGGHGTTGVVNVASGGHLAPGNSPGLLSTGNLSLVSGATFEEEIGGTAAGSGYDQVRVNGSVNLGNATLNISLVNSFVVTATDNFTIINNDGSDAVTGQFAGLVEGARLAVGSRTFIITYHGGDGNDVVLKALKDTGQDFNADGMGDIFWEVDGGPLAIWEMNAAQIAFADYTRAGSSAVGRPAADWHVVDTGDLNGDGKSDVLWRTDGGALALWQMDGSQITAADYLRRGATQLGTPAADWHALGVLDADGDSKSDILWRTDSGALAIWEMDGNQLKSADYIRLGSTAVGVPAPDWNIVGTGDFDSDGKGDILWRTDGGALAVWLLDGIQIKSAQYLKTGSVNVAAPGADWHISDVADFNGDGRADILWRIGAAQTGDLPPGGGQVAIWEMNGNQVAFADYTRLGSTVVGAPATDWHLLGADDYSGDRKADLLWRTDGGALAIWQMDGTHVASAGFTQAGSTPTGAPGSNWHVYQHHYDLV